MTSNPYINVLRGLEVELFPVVAVERKTGTFVLPIGIKVARGLSGLTLIFVVGVSALSFVKRRSRVVRLDTSTSKTFTSQTLFLLFTLVGSLVQLLYLSHLPDPHHTINLVSNSFRNLALLTEAIFLTSIFANDLARHISDTENSAQSNWFRGKRFKISSIVGGTVLLLAELAISFNHLFSSLALRASFYRARTNLLLLATSSSSDQPTTSSIMRVMAGPIEVLQRDLQRMRWSEIGKDTVQVATQVVIMLVSLLLISSVSSHLPRFSRPLRTLPQRIRFKRASSISKLPIAVVEQVPADAVEVEESLERKEFRQSVKALAALTISIFLFTILSNYNLALDILGRRWTSPIASFAPTQLWSSYLFSALSLSTLSYLTYPHLSASSPTRSLIPSSIMALVPLSGVRRNQAHDEGYVIPPSSTPPPLSPPTSLEEDSLDKYTPISSPDSCLDTIPVLRSFPFPLTTTSSTDSLDSTRSTSSGTSSSSSIGFDTRTS